MNNFLQPIAYVLWIAAVWNIISGIYWVVKIHGHPDMGPLIGYVMLGQKASLAGILGLLGCLVWKAFK